jgi:hypothetical protein
MMPFQAGEFGQRVDGLVDGLLQGLLASPWAATAHDTRLGSQ